MKNIKLFVALLVLPFSFALAETGPGHDSQQQAIIDGIRARLNANRPGMPIDKITPTVIDGYYEVQIGGQIVHTNVEADHLFLSDLFVFQNGMLVNVSEQSRVGIRKELLATADESDMVVFAPPPELTKTTVTVFTDIDCGYCRKLHQEVPELNRLGIAVRYLAYPRAGLGSESFNKAVSAWCADDPQKALTMAKAGSEIEQRTCANPVAAHLALGREVGVTGTPAVIYEDGTLQGGYLPAQDMAVRLGILPGS